MFVQTITAASLAVGSALALYPKSDCSTASSCSVGQTEYVMADHHDKHAGEEKILDVAASAGQFNTLAAAIKAAGLAETLNGSGPFTVFAPTDEAFAKLGKEKIAELLKPENQKQLQAVLTYHVVPGKVMAADAEKVGEAQTVQGGELDFSKEDGQLVVNDSRIIKADIKASNGVIHVIDTVLLPS